MTDNSNNADKINLVLSDPHVLHVRFSDDVTRFVASDDVNSVFFSRMSLASLLSYECPAA